MPVYQSLCQDDMLEKCLHGKTQNANESFNGTIWNKVPKANQVGLNTLCFGVYDAISHFNIGEKATLDTLSLVGVNPGYYTSKLCGSINKTRCHSIYKSFKSSEKTR